MGLTTDDHLAIQQLVARYNHAIDGGDGSAYADTFVTDGALDAGSFVVEGRNALVEFASTFANSQDAPHHVATSLVLDGDGDRARLHAYVQLYVRRGEPPHHQVAASGLYDDTLVKADGQWRFVRRTFTLD